MLTIKTTLSNHWLSIFRFVQVRALSWFFLGVLSLIAIISTRLTLEQNQTLTSKNTPQTLRHHLPDYTVTGLHIWRTSVDGNTQSELSADSLIHYRDDLSSIITNPVLTAKTSSTPESHANSVLFKPNQHLNIQNVIQAKQAVLRNEGELIEFVGNVHITRSVPNSPSSSLQTERISLLPDTNQLFSKTETTFIQGNHSIVSKNGIEYAHNDAQLQLNGPIKAVLMPNPSF
jgi:LPS export ABC transporter protein LptC